MNIEKEIYRLGEMYRVSKVEGSKEFYSGYISLIIKEEPKEKQSKLEKMWEWEIE